MKPTQKPGDFLRLSMIASLWKVERVMNGDVIMAAATVVYAEEQTCGSLLKAPHVFWEPHWVL